MEFLQHFLQLRKFSRAVRKAFAGRMLCRPDLGFSKQGIFLCLRRNKTFFSKLQQFKSVT